MGDLLRIVHVASDDAWGGAERVLSVLIPAQAERSDLRIEAVLLNEGALAAQLKRAGIAVHIVPERGASLGSLLRALRRATAPADVVHAHRYKEIALASLARSPGQRMLATIHGLQPFRQMPAEGMKIWASLWLGRIRNCCFVTVSSELRSRLLRGLLTSNVTHIPNPFVPRTSSGPVTDLRAHFGWQEDRPLVGFAGRLEPVKGPDLLLDAVELLDEGVGVVFIGAGSLGDELRNRCNQRGLASRVGFLGEVPDARPYLNQFDALALPSRHEGLPMILLEAADAGLPVAGFEVGGVAEVLTDLTATRRVAAGDVRGLALALASLLEDRSAAALSAEGWRRSLSAQFSLDSVVASYADLYRASI